MIYKPYDKLAHYVYPGIKDEWKLFIYELSDYFQTVWISKRDDERLQRIELELEKSKPLRAMQDKLIDLAVKRGFSRDMRVSKDMPEDITLYMLHIQIYPEHEQILKGVLAGLKRQF